MEIRWHVFEGRLSEDSPCEFVLPHGGIVGLVVSVHDPEQAGRWRAAEHGEQKSQGGGFHATYQAGASGDVVTVWFDGRLRAEPMRLVYAIPTS